MFFLFFQKSQNSTTPSSEEVSLEARDEEIELNRDYNQGFYKLIQSMKQVFYNVKYFRNFIITTLTFSLFS